jgi:hypothetical protein
MGYVTCFGGRSNTYSNFVGESHGSIPKGDLNQNSERKGGGKVVPVTGRRGPYGCEMSRLTHFLSLSIILAGLP